MENGWSLFNNSNSSSTSGSRGQNGHCTNHAWDIWDLGTTPRFDWNTTTTTTTTTSTNNSFHELVDAPHSAAAAATYAEASAVHALMLSHHHHHYEQQGHNAHPAAAAASLYAGGGSQYQPDPHLMCLKLGKRHYFEDATGLGGERHVDGGLSVAVSKRGRGYFGGGGGGGISSVGPSAAAAVTVASAAGVPRCQVEGCHVALVNAKDYHRRHKVCEKHAKAPQVVVLGLDQRFCQQCSRFHLVSEFDDTKRSCRRRLAGHNERRRKGSSHHDPTVQPRNPPHQGRALSLLSSKNNSWFSSADLSTRCSAALRELIAENRASIMAHQLVHPDHPTQHGSNPLLSSHHEMLPQNWDRFNESGGGHVTLDLMQAPSSAFGFLSMREKSKAEEEEECSELWRSLGGAHVV